MLFDLTNAPAIFQHLINNIFCEFLDDFVVCYLDDILIFSKDEKNHENHVQLVLKKLCTARLYGKLEKCILHQSQIEFFGYIIFGKGLSMDLQKNLNHHQMEETNNHLRYLVFSWLCKFPLDFYQRLFQDSCSIDSLTYKDKLE